MLRRKARFAIIWSGIDTFLRLGLGFVVTVILARLLIPEDFGIVAVLALFLGLAQVFLNAGFSAALIQDQSVSHIDESTAFWLNLSAGLVFTVVLWLLSPWIAYFFKIPVLEPLAKLMSFTILLSSLGSIHSTLLDKRLEFKTPMKITAISTFSSGVVAVYMAWVGYGVWALAGQAITSSVVDAVLLWALFPWRPAFKFSTVSFKRLFGFGGYLFVAGLLNTMYRQGYTLLLGKFYGTYDLGIYRRAENTQAIPVMSLSMILSRVVFPLFSKVNNDREKLRHAVRFSIRSIMLITAPTMAGLAVLAEPFVHVVFGEKWLPSVHLLQILCVAGLLLPLQRINIHALHAQGYARLYFRLEVIKKTIGISLIVLGSFIGITGVAWAAAIHSVIEFMINSHYTGKHINYGLREQVQDCMPVIFLSAIMATIIACFEMAIAVVDGVDLMLLIVFGSLFYIGSNKLLGISAFNEAVSFIKNRKE